MFRINSTFVVLLDACVLYPAGMRDLLITLSHAGLFRARCTAQIHEEWMRSLKDTRPDIPAIAVDRTKALMDQAMDGWLIEGYESLIEGLDLPDNNDRHVLAAAVRGRCDMIITQNLKHFPPDKLAPFEIEALGPDEFLSMQIDIDQPTFITGVRKVRNRLKKPPLSPQDYIDSLVAQGLPQTAEVLTKWIDLI